MLAPLRAPPGFRAVDKLGTGSFGAGPRSPSPARSCWSRKTIELPVRVGGRVRGKVVVAADADESAVVCRSGRGAQLAAHLGDTPPRKVIYVPGRILNLVV
ncbi:MAG: hypothetical protein R2695_04700 [Acidimicrobiales bacterium]